MLDKAYMWKLAHNITTTHNIHNTCTRQWRRWYHVYKEVWTSYGSGKGKRSSFLKYLKRAMWLLLVLLTICYTHNRIFCATICHAHNYKKLARDIFTMELNSWNSQKFSNANVSRTTVYTVYTCLESQLSFDNHL